MPNTPDSRKIISLAALSEFKTLLIQDFNGRYVPYLGADASVNLGANNFITSSYFEARSVSNDVINAYTRYRAGSVVVEDASAQNTKIINFPEAQYLNNSNTFATQEWANGQFLSLANGGIMSGSTPIYFNDIYHSIRYVAQNSSHGAGLQLEGANIFLQTTTGDIVLTPGTNRKLYYGSVTANDEIVRKGDISGGYFPLTGGTITGNVIIQSDVSRSLSVKGGTNYQGGGEVVIKTTVISGGAEGSVEITDRQDNTTKYRANGIYPNGSSYCLTFPSLSNADDTFATQGWVQSQGYTTLTLVSSGGNNGSASTAARSDHTHAAATAATFDDSNSTWSGGSNGFLTAEEKGYLSYWKDGEFYNYDQTKLIAFNVSMSIGYNAVTHQSYTSIIRFPHTTTDQDVTLATQEWVSSQGFATASSYLPLSGGSLTGTLSASSSTDSVSPGDAAIEIRERSRGGTGVSETYANAPRIGFHWSDRYWANLAYISNEFRFINNNAGSYVNIRAASVYENDIALSDKYLSKTGDGTKPAMSNITLSTNIWGTNPDTWTADYDVAPGYPYGQLIRFKSNVSGAIQLTDFYVKDGADALWVRSNWNAQNNAESAGWAAWHRIALYSDIPSSLPANGGNADTVDGYHAADLVNYGGNQTGIGSGSPFSGATSWFDNYGNINALIYNTNGIEYSMLGSQSPSRSYGSILRWGYNDTYLYIARKNGGSWQSQDWEKISAGYADSAGSASTATSATSAGSATDASYLVQHALSSEEIPSAGYHFGVYYGTPTGLSNDGHVMSFNWGTGGASQAYGAQIFVDTDPTYKICLRQRDSSGNWNSWIDIITDNNLGSKITSSMVTNALGYTPPTTDHTYNFSGVQFNSGNSSNCEHNANSAVNNGHYYYTSNGPSNLGESTSDGALYVQSYSDSWVAQIAQDYRNGRLFVRGKNNGTWSDWKRIAQYDELLQLVSSGGNNGSATTAARSDHTHAVAVAETLDSDDVPIMGTGSSGFMSAHDKTTIDRLENGFWHGGEWDWGSFSIIDLNQGSIFRRKTVYHPTVVVYETNFKFPEANSNAIETLATEEWVQSQSYTTNTGTVTSVRVQAGTGLTSSQNTAQTGTLDTTISIDSGYKLPTTTEWNNKSSVSGTNDGTNWTSITIDGTTKNIPSGGGSTVYHHILHLRINYQIFAYAFDSTSNASTTLATLSSKLALNPSAVLCSEYNTGDMIHILSASYDKRTGIVTIQVGDWYTKNGSNYMVRSSAGGFTITIESESITEA